MRTFFVLAVVRVNHSGATRALLKEFGQSLNNFRYNPRPSFSAAPASAVFMKLIVKVFPEITIKSRPVRKHFIRQLSKNIRAVLKDLDPELEVTGVWDNLEVQTRQTEPKLLREMIERLTCVPGITHFLEVHEYPLGDFVDVLEKC